MGNTELPVQINNITLRVNTKQELLGLNKWQHYQCEIIVTSKDEEKQMLRILEKRFKTLSKSQYICSVESYEKIDYKGPEQLISNTCIYQKQIIVNYQPYNQRLNQIPIHHYQQMFPTNQIYYFIKCISLGLLAFRKSRLHHGDLFMDNICRSGKKWQIIDKDFRKFGLGAYQTVLEGETAFITPPQMQRLKYGFVKQSPIIHEADDIFALGMIVLQLGSRQQSNKCYHRTFTRLNEQAISHHIRILTANHGLRLQNLVVSMLEYYEESRATLDNILKYPEVFNSQRVSIMNSKPFKDRQKNSHSRISKDSANKSTEIYNSNYTLMTKSRGMLSTRNQTNKTQLQLQNNDQQSRNSIHTRNQSLGVLKHSEVSPFKEKGGVISVRKNENPRQIYYKLDNKKSIKPMFRNSVKVANSIKNKASEKAYYPYFADSNFQSHRNLSLNK